MTNQTESKKLRGYPVQAGINTNVQILNIAWKTKMYGTQEGTPTLMMTLRTYKPEIGSEKKLNTDVDTSMFLTQEQKEELDDDQNTKSVVPEQGDIEVLPSWVTSKTTNRNDEPYSDVVYKMQYPRLQGMFMLYARVLGEGFIKSFKRFAEGSKFYNGNNFEESYYDKPEEMLMFYKDVSKFLEEVFNANQAKFTSPRFNVLMQAQSRQIPNDVGEKKDITIQYCEFPRLRRPESWFEEYIEGKDQTLINLKTDSGRNYYARFLNSHIKAGDNYIKNDKYDQLFKGEESEEEETVKASSNDDLPF